MQQRKQIRNVLASDLTGNFTGSLVQQ